MELVNQLDVEDCSLQFVPRNVDETILDGYLLIKDEEIRLTIQLSSPSTLKNARFSCEWRLKHLIKGYEETLNKRLQQSSTLLNFLEELRTLVENLLCIHRDTHATSVSLVCTTLVNEMAKIGWDKLTYVDKDFHSIKLNTRDENERVHTITVKVDDQNGLKFSCITDLPVKFEPRAGKDCGLQVIYDQFVQVVHMFQCFWNNVEEIDKCCWVLEPECVTYNCTYRRIALGKNLSITIHIDPTQVQAFPECRLLGAEHATQPLKERLNDIASLWSDKVTILENLKLVLGINIPSPAVVSKNEVSMECGVCYSYRLFDELPERTCDNPKCGQIFHNSCLVEWLKSVPSSTHRQTFNVVFGECPYCCKPITARVEKQMS